MEKSEIHLLVQYYRCATPERQVEIDTCLRNNLLNPLITTIHLLTEELFDLSSFPCFKKIIQTVIGERLTFERAFRYANEKDPGGACVWMLSNADIYFDESLRFVEGQNLNKVVYALTRHDEQPDGSLQIVPPEYAHGCQDVWMFRAIIQETNLYASYFLGVAGCDHRIAYEFVTAGYAVANPSLIIIARHLDLSLKQSIKEKTNTYSEWMNEEGYLLGKAVSPPYLYGIFPSEKLAYPDPELQRQYVLAASKTFTLEIKVKDLEGTISSLERTRSQLENQLNRNNQVIYDQSVALDVYSKHINALENSASWKITEPLRQVGNFAMKFTAKTQKDGAAANSNTNDIFDLFRETKTRCVLIIDFDLGGGSNLYSDKLKKYLSGNNANVVIVKYVYGMKKYRVQTLVAGKTADCTLDRRQVLQLIYKSSHIANNIIVNQIVSWPDTHEVIASITKSKVPYIVLAHDYFFVCPNWTLFDSQRKYCGVPADLSVCRTCLSALGELDICLAHHMKTPDMKKWREAGCKFLSQAEKVVCFSAVSQKIIEKAYPFLTNTIINEHCVPDAQTFTWSEKHVDCNDELTIAVIGCLNEAKGSKILEQLLNSDRMTDLSVRIVLVGTIYPVPIREGANSNKFIIHGSYARHELGDILSHYGASVILIPSLCPETFCFTASEALLLGYPVICFDVGAQAERIKGYCAGWLIDRMDPIVGIVDTIEGIIAHPEQIRTLSNNTRNYTSPSDEVHFAFCKGM